MARRTLISSRGVPERRRVEGHIQKAQETRRILPGFLAVVCVVTPADRSAPPESIEVLRSELTTNHCGS